MHCIIIYIYICRTNLKPKKMTLTQGQKIQSKTFKGIYTVVKQTENYVITTRGGKYHDIPLEDVTEVSKNPHENNHNKIG